MKAKAPIVIPPKRTYRKRIFLIAWIPSSLFPINDGECELTFDRLVPGLETLLRREGMPMIMFFRWQSP